MKKKELIYSEPVREIMGNPPGTILRWGTAVIFSVFTLFIVLAWIIRYPDLVPSPVEITTENPPVTLVSRLSGKIKHLYVKDGEDVREGMILAVMETAADMDDILLLREFTDTAKTEDSSGPGIIPDLSMLGELQNFYGNYMKSSSDLGIFYKTDYYGNRIRSVKEELAGLRNYISQLRISERLMAENIDLEINRFRRDSLLRNRETIAEADYEKSRQELNRQRLSLQNVRLEIAQKRMDEINKEIMAEEYEIKREEELGMLLTARNEALKNLTAQLEIWENKYLLISPVGGKVTFTRYWRENQNLLENEPVLSVVPRDQGRYIGRILLGMQRSGKVDTGQNVYVKLSGFPYLEYGVLAGITRNKSLVPSGDAYVIEIEFPDGLTTLYGKRLPFTQNMQGVAEIITDDRSLLVRIVSPFRHLLSVNRAD